MNGRHYFKKSLSEALLAGASISSNLERLNSDFARSCCQQGHMREAAGRAWKEFMLTLGIFIILCLAHFASLFGAREQANQNRCANFSRYFLVRR